MRFGGMSRVLHTHELVGVRNRTDMAWTDLVGMPMMNRFEPPSDRIRRFLNGSRKRCAANPGNYRGTNLTGAFFELCPRRPFWERYALSMAHAMRSEPVHLLDDELLVGMVYQTGPARGARSRENGELWRPYSPAHHIRMRVDQEIDPYVRSTVGFSQGHIGWRWDRILERGVLGHMELIREYLAEAKDVKARRLYRGALILWQAVLDWNEGHVSALREKALVAPAGDRERLEQLVEICSRVPRYPARTFHEAVQSFHFQHLALMFENPQGGNGPGRLDYLLWPYLERDLARGIITLEQARDLIDELFIRFEERLHGLDGWVEAIVVGGSDTDGKAAVSPISSMMVESTVTLGLVHPAVYMRLSEHSPEDFVDLSVHFLLEGDNRAQIYNDDACIPAMVRSGVSPQDAAMYMAGGCMEISTQGMSSDLNFATTHNVAKTFELVLNGGVDMLTGERAISHQRDFTEYQDFDDLYSAFEAELQREYREMARALDIASRYYAKYRPCYLLSSLVDDCLERGREQQDGGARYHDYGFAPLGITTVADSLLAIKRSVYEEQFTTPHELLAALRSDFVGYETLQARLRQLPKFGVEDPDADAMCDRVLTSACTLATQQRTRFGGLLKPMVFNFVWTPQASRELGARADGSNAGDSIGHGMTPLSSAMTRGITSAINSSTGLTYDCVAGGATTMWDCDEEWINFDLLKALLRVFLARGGMIFQGNMTSVQELIEAVQHPEDHPNLVVRVGGFSAHFVSLDPDLQQEIISRRRYAG